MHGFLSAVTIRERKPPLSSGINCAWLIGGVARHSLVVLRAILDTAPLPPEPISFLTLAMFMIGSMLYLAIIPLTFYRLTFAPLQLRDFTSPYWVNMGAVAISASPTRC